MPFNSEIPLHFVGGLFFAQQPVGCNARDPASRGFLSPVLQPVIIILSNCPWVTSVSSLMIKKPGRPYPTIFAYDRMYDLFYTIPPFATTSGVLLVFPAMVYIHAVERFCADRGGSFRMVDQK